MLEIVDGATEISTFMLSYIFSTQQHMSPNVLAHQHVFMKLALYNKTCTRKWLNSKFTVLQYINSIKNFPIALMMKKSVDTSRYM